MEKSRFSVMSVKRYLKKFELTIHKRTHNGESHTTVVSIRRNLLNYLIYECINKVTQEKTHLSHICEKAFAQLSNLENHKISHTGKKLKAFAQSVNLKTYKLFHTEEKHL